MVVAAEGVEVAAAGVVFVKAHAAVARDAPVHLVVDERAEILVAERALVELEAAVGVTGHHGHVLQMTFAPLVAHRAVVRMIGHEPFDDAGSELARLGIGDRDARPIDGGQHAGHHQPAARVVLVLELLHRALPARAHRAEHRMPAEVGKIEPEREGDLKEVLRRVGLEGLIIDGDRRHCSAPCFAQSALECGASQRRFSSRAAPCLAWNHQVSSATLSVSALNE